MQRGAGHRRNQDAAAVGGGAFGAAAIGTGKLSDGTANADAAAGRPIVGGSSGSGDASRKAWFPSLRMGGGQQRAEKSLVGDSGATGSTALPSEQASTLGTRTLQAGADNSGGPAQPTGHAKTPSSGSAPSHGSDASAAKSFARKNLLDTQVATKEEPVVWTAEECRLYLTTLYTVSLPGEEPILNFLSDAVAAAPLPVPWVMRRDSENRVFFANPPAEVVSWFHPLEPSLRELAGAFRVCLTLNSTLRRSCVQSLHDTWEQEARAELTKWYSVKHESGRAYFCHRDTGEAMWEHPAEVILPAHYLKLTAIEWLLNDEYYNSLLEGQPSVVADDATTRRLASSLPPPLASSAEVAAESTLLPRAKPGQGQLPSPGSSPSRRVPRGTGAVELDQVRRDLEQQLRQALSSQRALQEELSSAELELKAAREADQGNRLRILQAESELAQERLRTEQARSELQLGNAEAPHPTASTEAARWARLESSELRLQQELALVGAERERLAKGQAAVAEAQRLAERKERDGAEEVERRSRARQEELDQRHEALQEEKRLLAAERRRLAAVEGARAQATARVASLAAARAEAEMKATQDTNHQLREMATKAEEELAEERRLIRLERERLQGGGHEGDAGGAPDSQQVRESAEAKLEAVEKVLREREAALAVQLSEAEKLQAELRRERAGRVGLGGANAELVARQKLLEEQLHEALAAKAALEGELRNSRSGKTAAGAPSALSRPQSSKVKPSPRSARSSISSAADVTRMVVLHDFDPASIAPPGRINEFLPLEVGQQIQVLPGSTGDWVVGHVVGAPEKRGYFPLSHVVSIAGYKDMMWQYEAETPRWIQSCRAPAAPLEEAIGPLESTALPAKASQAEVEEPPAPAPKATETVEPEVPPAKASQAEREEPPAPAPAPEAAETVEPEVPPAKAPQAEPEEPPALAPESIETPEPVAPPAKAPQAELEDSAADNLLGASLPELLQDEAPVQAPAPVSLQRPISAFTATPAAAPEIAPCQAPEEPSIDVALESVLEKALLCSPGKVVEPEEMPAESPMKAAEPQEAKAALLEKVVEVEKVPVPTPEKVVEPEEVQEPAQEKVVEPEDVPVPVPEKAVEPEEVPAPSSEKAQAFVPEELQKPSPQKAVEPQESQEASCKKVDEPEEPPAKLPEKEMPVEEEEDEEATRPTTSWSREAYEPEPEARLDFADPVKKATEEATRKARDVLKERADRAEDEVLLERRRVQQAQRNYSELASSCDRATASLQEAQRAKAGLQARLAALEKALREREAQAEREAAGPAPAAIGEAPPAQPSKSTSSSPKASSPERKEEAPPEAQPTPEAALAVEAPLLPPPLPAKELDAPAAEQAAEPPARKALEEVPEAAAAPAPDGVVPSEKPAEPAEDFAARRETREVAKRVSSHIFVAVSRRSPPEVVARRESREAARGLSALAYAAAARRLSEADSEAPLASPQTAEEFAEAEKQRESAVKRWNEVERMNDTLKDKIAVTEQALRRTWQKWRTEERVSTAMSQMKEQRQIGDRTREECSKLSMSMVSALESAEQASGECSEIEKRLSMAEQLLKERQAAAAEESERRKSELQRELAEERAQVAELESTRAGLDAKNRKLEEQLREVAAMQADLVEELRRKEADLALHAALPADLGAQRSSCSRSASSREEASEAVSGDSVQKPTSHKAAHSSRSARTPQRPGTADDSVKAKPAQKRFEDVVDAVMKPRRHKSSSSTAEPVAVTSSMTVKNVDYRQLSANPALLSSFTEAMKRTIASSAGPGVLPEHVELSLSAGSVVVQARITPPRGVSAAAVSSELKAAPLSEVVASTVASLEGIKEAATGPISVAEIRVVTPEPSPRIHKASRTIGDARAQREKEARKSRRALEDAIVLASRIQLLRAEAARTQKRIRQTQEKAEVLATAATSTQLHALPSGQPSAFPWPSGALCVGDAAETTRSKGLRQSIAETSDGGTRLAAQELLQAMGCEVSEAECGELAESVELSFALVVRSKITASKDHMRRLNAALEAEVAQLQGEMQRALQKAASLAAKA